MTPPQDLIDQLLMTNSANRTMAALREAGYEIAFMRVTDRLSQLIHEGKRAPISQKERDGTDYSRVDIPKGMSLEGSEKLLDACMAMYARKAARYGLSVEEAMLTTLYAPADVMAWRAAA